MAIGPIASLNEVVAGHMTSPVNLPQIRHTPKRDGGNILSVIEISLEYDEVTFLQVGKQIGSM
jgi:hypothetical protein